MKTLATLLPIIGCTLLLAACTGHQLRDDETESFQTRILQDGTKLFDYRLDTPQGSMQKPKLVFDAEETMDQNSAPEMKPYSAADDKARVEARVMALIDDKLDVTGYCRDGFVVVEKVIGFSHSAVTGECRDTASDADREQY